MMLGRRARCVLAREGVLHALVSRRKDWCPCVHTLYSYSSIDNPALEPSLRLCVCVCVKFHKSKLCGTQALPILAMEEMEKHTVLTCPVYWCIILLYKSLESV